MGISLPSTFWGVIGDKSCYITHKKKCFSTFENLSKKDDTGFV